MYNDCAVGSNRVGPPNYAQQEVALRNINLMICTHERKTTRCAFFMLFFQLRSKKVLKYYIKYYIKL